jgi:hypothetical protein
MPELCPDPCTTAAIATSAKILPPAPIAPGAAAEAGLPALTPAGQAALEAAQALAKKGRIPKSARTGGLRPEPGSRTALDRAHAVARWT